MPTKVFQSAIFDSDLFQISIRASPRIFQNTIFDTDIFQQITTVSTVDNVFQSDIFQQLYNGRLLFQKAYTPTPSGQITKIFQTNVFDNDLFQQSFTVSIYPRKLFQTNVFQDVVFQVRQLANTGKYIFQSGLFQGNVFDVPNLIKISISEIIGITEEEIAPKIGFAKFADDMVSILLSAYKVLGLARSGLDVVSATELQYHTRARNKIKPDQLDLSEFIVFKKKTDIRFVNKLFQSNIFQSSIFQSRYKRIRETADKIFQSIFQSDVFQTAGHKVLEIPKVFQSIFQSNVFQATHTISNLAPFQTNIFQQGLFQITQAKKFAAPDSVGIAETISVLKEKVIAKTVPLDTVGITETNVGLAEKTVIKTAPLDSVSISESRLSRLSKLKILGDPVGIVENVVGLAVRDPNVVAKLFQTNIFDQDIFQKRYLKARTQIAKAFQSNVFQQNIFQKVFSPLTAGRVFQSNVFSIKLFQQAVKYADIGKVRDVFQSGLYDDRIFQTTVPIPKTDEDSVGIDESIAYFRVRKHQLYGNDNIGITEATVERTGRPQAITETVGIDDVLVKVFGKARVAPVDTVGITEVVAFKKHKVIEETISITEQVIRPRTIIRTITESNVISEFRQRLRKPTVRIVNESIGITESIRKPWFKRISEAVGLSETVVRTRKVLRTIAENVGIVESGKPEFYKIPKKIIPTVFQSFFDSKVFQNSYDFNIIKKAIFQSNIFDNDLFQQLYQPLARVKKAVFDPEIFQKDVFQFDYNIEKTLARLFQRNVFQNNIFQGRKLFKAVTAIKKVFQTNVFQTDQLNRVFQQAFDTSVVKIRNIFSGIYQYPLFQSPAPIKVSLDEKKIAISEALRTVFGRPQRIFETIGISEIIPRARTIARSVGDSVGISDSIPIFKQRTWKLPQYDTIGITESTAIKKRQVTYFVNKVFQTNLFDQDVFQKKWDQHRAITKVFQSNIFDNDVFSQGFNKFIIQPIFQSDVFAGKFWQKLYDTRKLAKFVFGGIFQSDVFQAPFKKKFTVADNVGITEAAIKVKGFAQRVSESLGITEALSKVSRKQLTKVVSDAVGITETKKYAKLLKKVVSESLTIIDFTKHKLEQVIFTIPRVFQTNIFDQDIFQKLWDPSITTVSKLFQTNIFDTDVFQQVFKTNIIPKVFQSIFQSTVFQTKVHDILKKSKVIFQGGLFQVNTFQTAQVLKKAIYDTIT